MAKKKIKINQKIRNPWIILMKIVIISDEIENIINLEFILRFLIFVKNKKYVLIEFNII